ncbi:MAG TPA: YebC/PmpR family DNA-binding transcriptional regulator [Candidatus Paceibacterota bacterium]
MSGHNKWSKIKHKKASEDAKKSKTFSMHAKAIAMESKRVSGDINSPSLRAVIDRAKAVNMPADNIARAIEKGKSNNGDNLEEVIYEAYGPGGVAIIIEGITDNKNRTTPEIKHLLSKQGISLGAQNSALWAFTKNENGYRANVIIPLSDIDTENLLNIIDILEEHEDVKSIYTNANI